MNNKQWEEEKIKSEASVFWSKISEYLPKSLERSAIGDETIFRAFFQAYTEFRPFILSQREAEIRKETIEAVKASNVDYLKKLCWTDKDIEYFLNQYNQ